MRGGIIIPPLVRNGIPDVRYSVLYPSELHPL